jgi:hypothetical protein
MMSRHTLVLFIWVTFYYQKCVVDCKSSIITETFSFLWPPPDEKSSGSAIAKKGQSNVIQMSVILPARHELDSIELEAAQKRSGVGILVGLMEAKRRGLFSVSGNELIVNVTFRDSRCDNTYGPKSFTDAVVDGVDVLFGPSCEYALGK